MKLSENSLILWAENYVDHKVNSSSKFYINLIKIKLKKTPHRSMWITQMSVVMLLICKC